MLKPSLPGERPLLLVQRGPHEFPDFANGPVGVARVRGPAEPGPEPALAGVSWPCRTSGADPTGPYPGASGAAGGVEVRRWRIVSSNPAMSAASTPPPSATIQTFESSLAGAGVAALEGSTTSSTRATGSASSPTLGSVLAGRGVSPAVSFA